MGNDKAKGGRSLLIVSCGVGDKRFISRQAQAALKSAELFIGTPGLLRKMEPLLGIGRKASAVNAGEVRRIIEQADEKRIAVLSDGDAGYGALGEGYPSLVDLRPVIIPGMSMLSYIASKTGIPYGDAAVLDLNKPQAALLPVLEASRKVFVFGTSQMAGYFGEIVSAGLGSTAVFAVENPGLEGERIFRGTAAEAAGRHFAENTVYVFLRAQGSPRGKSGIPDEAFGDARRDMTEEIRAALFSKLKIAGDDVVYIIGSGLGDTAAETAVQASSGRVFAIEIDREKAKTAAETAVKMGLRNLNVIGGSAPEALAHLPAPDAAVITCCKDRIRDLLQILVSRNPRVKIAAVTHDMDFAVKTAGLMETMYFDTDEVMLSVSKRIKAGDRHCLRPEDPVFLVSGVRRTGIDHG